MGAPRAWIATGWSQDDDKDLQIDMGGQYRIMGNVSSFGWHPETTGNDEETRSFFNQRFRAWLDAKANSSVSGYLQVEMGHVLWGEDDEFTKTYGNDESGIELRRAYLTYANDAVGTLKVGIQDWSDTFGDVLASGDWDFNVAGLSPDFNLALGRRAAMNHKSPAQVPQYV